MDRIDIEKELAVCVRSIGGMVLEETLPHPRSFRNADYLFKDALVIAELKCLEKDVIASKAFHAKVNGLVERWDRAGLFTRPSQGSFVLHIHELPEVCARDFMDLIKAPL